MKQGVLCRQRRQNLKERLGSALDCPFEEEKYKNEMAERNCVCTDRPGPEVMLTKYHQDPPPTLDDPIVILDSRRSTVMFELTTIGPSQLPF